jgi:hypothetical protein
LHEFVLHFLFLNLSSLIFLMFDLCTLYLPYNFLILVCHSFVQNAPGDVVKAIYDVCFDAASRIILHSDEHSEIQVTLFDKKIYMYILFYYLILQ